ncbi:hypothetical protein PsorP6_003586 [Peronosclerospora sorghi]|uniref:Uncharacterized protein n=1 Tax=Peronosclerospora sorghi TaxID=230839 RepID=A0ACC0VNF3_9STRA|nr:hypothetical protein PsorP6_003586 [Peronosclerospora sorghi]
MDDGSNSFRAFPQSFLTIGFGILSLVNNIVNSRRCYYCFGDRGISGVSVWVKDHVLRQVFFNIPLPLAFE